MVVVVFPLHVTDRIIQHFKFRTRVQKLNSMEGSTRTSLNYVEKLSKFWSSQGRPMNRMPVLDKRPVDLFMIKKLVEQLGGYNSVTENKEWSKIGRELGFERKFCTSMSWSLRNNYEKFILPYEEFLAKQRSLERSTPGTTSSSAGSYRQRESLIKDQPIPSHTKNDVSVFDFLTDLIVGSLIKPTCLALCSLRFQ